MIIKEVFELVVDMIGIRIIRWFFIRIIGI